MKNLIPALALALLGLSGCASRLSSVSLQGSPAVAAASVQVDVVGLNERNAALKNLPVSGYWQGGSAQARGEVKHFRFGPGLPQTQTLAAGDPVWQRWSSSGVKEIMVIADLPGAFSDLPGDADPRRKIIPMSSKAPAASVLVDKSGLVRTSP